MARTKNAITIPPSSLSYQYKQCPRCWVRDILGDPLKPPRMPFPGIFHGIDRMMKAAFDNVPTAMLGADLPKGVIEPYNNMIESGPIGELDGLPIRFRGKQDSVICRYHSESITIPDFKTNTVKPENVERYSDQLHAYAYCWNNPRERVSTTVDSVGLINFDPFKFTLSNRNQGVAVYMGKLVWQEIPLDWQGFQERIKEIVALLNGPLPDAGADCTLCPQYDRAARTVAQYFDFEAVTGIELTDDVLNEMWQAISELDHDDKIWD